MSCAVTDTEAAPELYISSVMGRGVAARRGELMGEKILGVKEAAAFLGVSVAHLRNLCDGRVKGTPPIPCVRAGRRRLIRLSVLLRWIEEQEQSSGRDILSPTRINACVSGGNDET
jgi:hypothetical protein